MLEWVAISSSRGSSWPRDPIHLPCIGRRILYHWTTREAVSLRPNWMCRNPRGMSALKGGGEQKSDSRQFWFFKAFQLSSLDSHRLGRFVAKLQKDDLMLHISSEILKHHQMLSGLSESTPSSSRRTPHQGLPGVPEGRSGRGAEGGDPGGLPAFPPAPQAGEELSEHLAAARSSLGNETRCLCPEADLHLFEKRPGA